MLQGQGFCLPKQEHSLELGELVTDSHLVNLKARGRVTTLMAVLRGLQSPDKGCLGMVYVPDEGKLPVNVLKEVRELETPKAWHCDRQCLSQAAVLEGNEWALSKSRGCQELVGSVTSLEGGRFSQTAPIQCTHEPCLGPLGEKLPVLGRCFSTVRVRNSWVKTEEQSSQNCKCMKAGEEFSQAQIECSRHVFTGSLKISVILL